MRLALALGLFLTGCANLPPGPARAPVVPRAPVEVCPSTTAPSHAPETAVVEVHRPQTREPVELRLVPLVRVRGVDDVCARIRAELASTPDTTSTTVRTTCTANDGARLLPPEWKLVTVRTVTTMPRHGAVTSVYARLVVQGRSTLMQEDSFVAHGEMSMPRGDSDGRLELVRVDEVEHVSVSGSPSKRLAKAVVLTFAIEDGGAAVSASDEAAPRRKPLYSVVCERSGASCTGLVSPRDVLPPGVAEGTVP